MLQKNVAQKGNLDNVLNFEKKIKILTAFSIYPKKTACDIYSTLPGVTTTATRIMDGEEVTSDREFPWMVNIKNINNTSESQYSNILVSREFTQFFF